MKESNIVLIVLIVILVLFLFGMGCSTDQFKNMIGRYSYKLPVLGTVPNLQAATVPRREPSSSEEVINRGWNRQAPDQSILLKTLYANERTDMRFGQMTFKSDTVIDTEAEEDSIYARLDSASNSMFLNPI